MRSHCGSCSSRISGASPSGSCALALPGRKRTISPTVCWALAGAPPNRWRSCLRSANAGRFPKRLQSSWCTGCATRIPELRPALVWLDQRLAAQATTADEVVRAEHQRQGAASVTMRNIITSMRLISDVDWTELFERISLVDEALADDSGFRDMDFPTRNLYRSAIEELARGSKHAELDVARSAVLAAKQARSGDGSSLEFRCAETGYHLLGGGRRAFEALIGFRPPVSAWPGRFNRALGISGYVAAIVAVGALLLALPLVCLSALGLAGAVAAPARGFGCDPRDRRGRRARKSRRDAGIRRDALAGTGAPERRSPTSAHACRGADVSDFAGGDRRAS